MNKMRYECMECGLIFEDKKADGKRCVRCRGKIIPVPPPRQIRDLTIELKVTNTNMFNHVIRILVCLMNDRRIPEEVRLEYADKLFDYDSTVKDA